MKEVFKLIVSSFANLRSKFSNKMNTYIGRSYILNTYTLELVARVKLCCVMLDLQCDALLCEMFKIFLKTIDDLHLGHVFYAMMKIMTLVLEESDDIPPKMLSLLLHYVRKDSKVPPRSRRLAEKVLFICARKLKTVLTEAVKSSAVPLDKYSKIVASICKSSDIKEKTEPGALLYSNSKDVLRLPLDDSSVNAATSSENEEKTSVQALPATDGTK
ncbi:uncharacterized protein LOC112088980 [Eutrema salsugineum]|uniref:uncharacterized protein LOC112088980 n=1 Tax=Eutrema salsugineum TaxID=72664 RepID=UPI000CED1C0F|nr:uncharacterized protein LOC112088980 [Eutrema salsugineum]